MRKFNVEVKIVCYNNIISDKGLFVRFIVMVLMLIGMLYSAKLSIGFSSINPPRGIKSTTREMNDDDVIVKERHLNIRVKNLNFRKMNKEEKNDISESLDEFSVSLYNALNNSGPSLATKEQQEAKFDNLSYKGIALTPKNIKKVWVFHEDRKKYGIKFLSKLAKTQHLDIIIYQKVAKAKWKKFGEGLSKGEGSIKPTIAVFNNFSKAQTYTYPKILASYIENEEYEKMNSVIEDKSIEALKKAFSVGVIGSSVDTSKKTEVKSKTKTKINKTSKKEKLTVSDISDMGGTGGF